MKEDPSTNAEHLERLASLGMLAANVVHQVNGHLTYVLLNLERLECVATSREAREALGAAREGARAIRDLSRDVTLLARTTRQHEASFVDLRDIVRAATRITGPRLTSVASLVVELGAVPPARGNATRFLQVVINILLNAADACEGAEAGSRTVRVALGTDARGDAVVSVMDDGPGLPPELAAHVFDPFFTTKSPGKGTGLGLSLAKEIVEDAGGHMKFDSVEGLGTIVRLTIPAAREE